MRLKLLSREGCHLCEDLASDLTRLEIEFDTIDVDQDEELERCFGDAVPVLMLGEREIARAPLTAASLRSTLTEAGLLVETGS